METSILFVQETSGFLINAIISSLQKEDIQCATSSYAIDNISKYIEEYTYVFLSLDKDTAFRHSKELIYIRDQVGFESKRVMMMGGPTEISECIGTITENCIHECFVRPINTRDVVEKILDAFTVQEELANRKNILVVDDSGTFLHTIREWLEPTYKVIMSSSATSAISYLAANTPDLILLDYEMPVCSGPKLLEMIRSDESNKEIPVIFLTGKGDRESVQQVLSLHPQGYLLKSLPKNKILQSLAEFFDSIDSIDSIE